MSQSASKKRRFLATHSRCCFCGGGEASVTVDHIPARTCFKGRHYPEGFEFPACAHCQGASRIDEMAFAFYVRLLDRNPANFDPDETDRMIVGLKNNIPNIFPEPVVGSRDKRKILRQMGLAKPPGLLASDIPAVRFDPVVHQHIDRYTRKIALALYYREQGCPAEVNHMMLASWGQSASHTYMAGMSGFIDMTPFTTVGRRSNMEFGDQFIYRCNKRLGPDVFAMIGQFGAGVVISCLIVEPDFAEKVEKLGAEEGIRPPSVWTSVRDNYPRDCVQTR